MTATFRQSGSLRWSYRGVGHAVSRFPVCELTLGGGSGSADVGDDNCGVVPRVSVTGYRGCEVERFGMCPAVMLGQDLSEVAGPVGDGAVADLAAGDRQLRNGHREAAGR
jgi:hypothetical protein